MNDKNIEIIETLKKTYPDAKCSLDFSSPFEMLIAVMLSAQCTDERVNKVTPSIFAKYSKPQDFVNMDISKLENLIRSCGFYKNKAKNIKLCSKKIIEDFNRKCSSKYGRFNKPSWRWQKKCKRYYA